MMIVFSLATSCTHILRINTPLAFDIKQNAGMHISHAHAHAHTHTHTHPHTFACGTNWRRQVGWFTSLLQLYLYNYKLEIRLPMFLLSNETNDNDRFHLCKMPDSLDKQVICLVLALFFVLKMHNVDNKWRYIYFPSCFFFIYLQHIRNNYFLIFITYIIYFLTFKILINFLI